MDYYEEAIKLTRTYKGKISIRPKMSDEEIYFSIAAAVGVEAQRSSIASTNKSYNELYEEAKAMILKESN